MPKPKETRIGCYGVIVDGEYILLCRLSDGLNNHGKWTLPGGGLEFGESFEEAMIREVKEETGFVVTSEQIASTHSRIHDLEEKTMHSLQILFEAKISGGTLVHEIEGTTDLAEWVLVKDIDATNSVDIVLDALRFLKQL